MILIFQENPQVDDIKLNLAEASFAMTVAVRLVHEQGRQR